MASTLHVNHETAELPGTAEPGPAVHVFHQRLPGYLATPLWDRPELAAAAGVGRVLVKDESSRLGLPAFIANVADNASRVVCATGDDTRLRIVRRKAVARSGSDISAARETP